MYSLQFYAYTPLCQLFILLLDNTSIKGFKYSLSNVWLDV